jgi:hypothetical protein
MSGRMLPNSSGCGKSLPASAHKQKGRLFRRRERLGRQSALFRHSRGRIAPYGNNVLYMTYEQLGADLQGTVSIVAVKSTDGGITFPQITRVTTPAVGVQPGDHRNIVYNVFFDRTSTQVYLARSTDEARGLLGARRVPGWKHLIVYPDDKNSGLPSGDAYTWFIRQTAGPTIIQTVQ